MKLFFVFCNLFIFSTNFVIAQSKTIQLVGYLGIEGGESFSYKIEAIDSLGYLKGYASAWLIEGKEVKAAINGFIDKKNKTLTFQETEIVANNGFESRKTICLIQASLSLNKENNNQSILWGNIVSNDVTNVTCARGSITFPESEKVKAIFEDNLLNKNAVVAPTKPIVKTPKKSMQIVYDTTALIVTKEKDAKAPSILKISQGMTKIIECQSDTILLQIWDDSQVDGDWIAFSQNGNTVLSKHILTKEKKEIKIVLINPIEELIITALNEGSEPPNTANINIVDGSITHRIIAYNTIGKKATIQLKKKL